MRVQFLETRKRNKIAYFEILGNNVSDRALDELQCNWSVYIYDFICNQ